jgi:hypothetical protein
MPVKHVRPQSVAALCCFLLPLWIAGCARESVDDAVLAAMKRTNDLKVVFAARAGTSSDRVMFVLHNEGQHEFHVTKVRVVRKDNNGSFQEVTSDLLKLTRRRIVSGGWEYGTLSLSDSNERFGDALRIECVSNGIVRSALCDIPEMKRSGRNVFSRTKTLTDCLCASTCLVMVRRTA